MKSNPLSNPSPVSSKRRPFGTALLGLLTALLFGLSGALTFAADPVPLGSWDFNENEGTTSADLSGTNNATLNGAIWSASKEAGLGSCLDFNGSTSLAEVPNNPPLQLTGPMTVSAWIYDRGADWGVQGMIVMQGSWGTGWGLYREGEGILRLFVTTGSDVFYNWSGSLIPLNQWVHVAGVFTGYSIQTYINGEMVNEAWWGNETPMDPRGSDYHRRRHL